MIEVNFLPALTGDIIALVLFGLLTLAMVVYLSRGERDLPANPPKCATCYTILRYQAGRCPNCGREYRLK